MGPVEREYREKLKAARMCLGIVEFENFLQWFQGQAIRDGVNPELVHEIIKDARQIK